MPLNPGPTEFMTFSGRLVDVTRPRPSDVTIDDVAHHLSRICRFGGACPWPYSVAQHSVLVCDIVAQETGDREVQLAALLHDASEAYVGDVVSPLKHSPAMVEYRRLEQAWERAIEQSFGLPRGALDDQRIHRADDVAFHTEWRDVFPTRPLLAGAVVAPVRVTPLGPDAAKAAFVAKFRLWRS